MTKNYVILCMSKTMKNQGIWNKTVHASFKKVIAFDLICMGLGVMIGMGVGAFIIGA